MCYSVSMCDLQEERVSPQFLERVPPQYPTFARFSQQQTPNAGTQKLAAAFLVKLDANTAMISQNIAAATHGRCIQIAERCSVLPDVVKCITIRPQQQNLQAPHKLADRCLISPTSAKHYHRRSKPDASNQRELAEEVSARYVE